MIPDGVDEVGPDQIQGDPKIVVIPSSVRTIDDATFYGCTRLERVVCLEGS